MGISKFFLRSICLVSLFFCHLLHSQNRLDNGSLVYEQLKKQGYLSRFAPQDMSHLRIAVIDSGFEGLDRYSTFGSKAQLIRVGDADLLGSNSSKHGFAMAQLFWFSSGAHLLPESKQPQLFLIQANGFTEFKKAIDFCIGQNTKSPGVDLVLHSRNFDWGTDFNGGGFFNHQVERATKAGIVWINSVGNTGGSVYYSDSFTSDSRGVVAVEGVQNMLLFENRFEDQSLKLTLSWSDFKSDVSFATRKDLDFALFFFDSQSKTMIAVPGGSSQKKQSGRHMKPGEQDVSGNAFEELRINLQDRGLYGIRIYDRSRNFHRSDRFQVIVESEKPDSIKFTHANKRFELTAPADVDDVISVGAVGAFSAVGTVGGVSKPDVVVSLGQTPMMFEYSDSFKTGLDTSTAAAVFAGVVASLMASDSAFTAIKLRGYLNYLKSQRQPWRWPLK